MSQYPQQIPPSNFPPYPGQPVYTPVQPPRKNRTGIWIAAIIVIVLLFGGGIFAYVIFQGQNAPISTLQQFCDGYKNQDSQAVYNTLSTPSQQKLSLSMIQKTLDPMKGMKIDCTVSNVQQSDSTATGIITINMPPTAARSIYILHTFQFKAILVQENGQWKISNFGS